MSQARKLTASAVKAMLTRAGVDHSGLEIRDDPVSVVIRGPEKLRHAALHVLLDRGLTVAPYSDRDEWMRR